MNTGLPTVVTVAEIKAAAERLAGPVLRTPLLRVPALDKQAGGTVLVKAEPLQRTGSFKIRGAFNRLAQLDAAERAAGVVAWSSGNHAQGVAAAGELLGVRTTIVMPADAPAIKLEATRAYGAEVVLYDRAREDREAIAREIAKTRSAVIVPSFDDPHIIAGQGTVGLEIADQARALGLTVDAAIVPTGGGGLIAGTGLALRDTFPDVRLYSAEPEFYDDHKRSLETGTRQTNARTANALCDALLSPSPGELTWAINRTQLAGGYAVSDTMVKAAVAFAFRALKVVVEPGGAAALAALTAGLHDGRDQVTAVVLSGGNVDPRTFTDCLGTV